MAYGVWRMAYVVKNKQKRTLTAHLLASEVPGSTAMLHLGQFHPMAPSHPQPASTHEAHFPSDNRPSDNRRQTTARQTTARQTTARQTPLLAIQPVHASA